MARKNFAPQNETQIPDNGFTISPTGIDDDKPEKKKTPQVIGETGIQTFDSPTTTGNTTIADIDLNHNDHILRTTGWLVCTKGNVLGRDFRLHNGWNYIGRDESLDIYLNDAMVDRRPTAKVAYDNRGRTFTVAPCEGAKNLVYLNNTALFGPSTINAYDRIVVGETELMLVPLCSDSFSWDE